MNYNKHNPRVRLHRKLSNIFQLTKIQYKVSFKFKILISHQNLTKRKKVLQKSKKSNNRNVSFKIVQNIKLNFNKNKIENCDGDQYECGDLPVEPEIIPSPIRMFSMKLEEVREIQYLMQEFKHLQEKNIEHSIITKIKIKNIY